MKTAFDGTVFRFPLRTEEQAAVSKLSTQVCTLTVASVQSEGREAEGEWKAESERGRGLRLATAMAKSVGCDFTWWGWCRRTQPSPCAVY
jgi:hypothetical protein